jgi:hypothetical protein
MPEEARTPARVNVNGVRAGEQRIEMSDAELRADTARSLGASKEDREGRAELAQRVGDGRLDVDPCAPETVGQRMAGGTLLDRVHEKPVERLHRIVRHRQLRGGTSELFDTAGDGRRHELVLGGEVTVQRPRPDARARGDLVERHLEPSLGESLRGGAQQPRPIGGSIRTELSSAWA